MSLIHKIIISISLFSIFITAGASENILWLECSTKEVNNIGNYYTEDSMYYTLWDELVTITQKDGKYYIIKSNMIIWVYDDVYDIQYSDSRENLLYIAQKTDWKYVLAINLQEVLESDITLYTASFIKWSERYGYIIWDKEEALLIKDWTAIASWLSYQNFKELSFSENWYVYAGQKSDWNWSLVMDWIQKFEYKDIVKIIYPYSSGNWYITLGIKDNEELALIENDMIIGNYKNIKRISVSEDSSNYSFYWIDENWNNIWIINSRDNFIYQYYDIIKYNTVWDAYYTASQDWINWFTVANWIQLDSYEKIKDILYYDYELYQLITVWWQDYIISTNDFSRWFQNIVFVSPNDKKEKMIFLELSWDKAIEYICSDIVSETKENYIEEEEEEEDYYNYIEEEKLYNEQDIPKTDYIYDSTPDWQYNLETKLDNFFYIFDENYSLEYRVIFLREFRDALKNILPAVEWIKREKAEFIKSIVDAKYIWTYKEFLRKW